MSKTTVSILIFTSVVLILGAFMLRGFNQSTAYPSQTGQSYWLNEVVHCAAYYQLSVDVLSKLPMPSQMANVVERLRGAAEASQALAKTRIKPAALEQQLENAKRGMQAVMPNSQSLAPLMAQYKDPCRALLTDPVARFDYWQKQAG